jgi:hypothetical protein
MAVPVKQSIPINFSQGLDTKTDPFQVPIGKFQALQNSIFQKGGMLQKRNGFGNLPALPDKSFTYLTTFNDGLTAIGSNLASYSAGTQTWINKGQIQPVSLNVMPLVRNNLNQSQCDSTTSSGGIVCTVYTEYNGSTTDYKYIISDSNTGQNIVAPSLIPVSAGTISGSPRVFLLGNYFVIVFTNTITGVHHLQYISVSILNPANVTTNADITSNYAPTMALSWDGVVSGNSLYVAYDTTSGGQSVQITALPLYKASVGGSPIADVTFPGQKATIMSLIVDSTIPASPVIWASYYDSTSSIGHSFAVNSVLGVLLPPTETITSGTVLNITSAAQNGICYVYYEVSNSYSYDSVVPTNYVNSVNVTQAGVVSSTTTIARSVGLASKAFIIDAVIYFLASYQSSYQPTYFLINATESLESMPVVVSKFAYENGVGYLTAGLPSVLVNGTTAMVSYLFKDLIAAVNKGTNLAAGTQVNGIYSQLGVNLITFNLTSANLSTTEIGLNLNLSGGFLWGFDGVTPVENNFFLYPDNVEVTTATGSGGLIAQEYFYQVTYEWTDNQGNAFRSAPSIPVSITTTTGASTNTIDVPYLRLTYKVNSPVKIVVYRWSQAQQIYYQVTSITQPILNNTTADSVAIVDSMSDAQILGNNIIYTNGGVIEDVSGPASNLLTLFDDRLWLVDAEDPNLLWYSKQVIESTPVEMSDLLTMYIAPSTAAQGSTGNITAIAPLDDKIVIFKNNAIYYVNGTGPDNTGANSQYSQPIFVTSTVGCANQNSIVFMPQGLMFQSDKGIWLLGRDMSTQYLGAPVEAFTTNSTALSAVNVPATNQIRFTMDSGITLMYDYYFGQWGTFIGINGISSTLYNGLHSFIDSFGRTFQETPGLYLDGSSPVLLSFTTGWINPAGLQGYIRSYFFFLLGKYYSPHKLILQIAYDYNSAPSQSTIIAPNNYNPPYGEIGPYGQESPYGGNSDIEQWRVFLDRQRCQAFQITLTEAYDYSIGAPAGAGFTLSGLNLIVGMKRAWRSNSAATDAGGSGS